MGTVQLTVMARSDVGRVRQKNEDACAVLDLESGAFLESPAVNVDVRAKGVLMVVSDGMGGHAAGEVASSLVIDSLRKYLSEPTADHESLQRVIDAAVRRANADVRQAAIEGRKEGMGATLTAVLIHNVEAYVAAVGDSRAYLLRAGRLRQVTKDQSFVQMLIDAGVMTPEEAKDSPQKNVILQAMGRDDKIRATIGRLRLRRGDRFLLCSDGVTNMVTDDELQAILGGRDLANTCNQMIDLANERGGDDNLTAVVAEVQGDEIPAPRPQERVTQTLEVLQEFGRNDQPAKPAPVPPVSHAPAAAANPPSRAPVAPEATPQKKSGVSPAWLMLGAGAMVFAVVVAALAWWLLR